MEVSLCNTFTFSRRFYPKRLTVHSGYTFVFICTCVPWELNPQPFAPVMQCSTTEPQEHNVFPSFKKNHPKIISSFTHPQVVPNLYECICSAEHKEDILKKVCNQAVLGHY